MRYPAPARTTRLTVAVTSLIAIAGISLAGCGPSGGKAPDGKAPDSTASTGSGAGTLATCSRYPSAKSCYFVTVTASGAEALQGTDTVPNQQPCADVLSRDAAGNGGEVQLSAPVFLSGPVASFNAFLDNYHGPGTYSSAGSDAGVQFLIRNVEYSAAGPASTVTALAVAGGSVAVTFTKLVSSGNPAGTITGRAEFTCRNT